MTRLFAMVFGFVTFGLSLPVLSASTAVDSDGDPKLCAGTGFKKNGMVSIASVCEILDTKTLDVSQNSDLAAFLKETKQVFWDKGRLSPNTLYRYQLTICNKTKERIVSVNFSGWEVLHSPYTSMARGFSFEIPESSSLRIRFLSPWPPERHNSPVNIGTRKLISEEWSSTGDGTAVILVPSWYQFLPERIYFFHDIAEECSPAVKK